ALDGLRACGSSRQRCRALRILRILCILRMGARADGKAACAENPGNDRRNGVPRGTGEPAPACGRSEWCMGGSDGPLPGRMHAPAGRLLVFDSHASSPRRKCRLQQAARPSEVITLARKRLLCDRNVRGTQPRRSLRAARFSETTGTERAVILGVDVRAGKVRYSGLNGNFK